MTIDEVVGGLGGIGIVGASLDEQDRTARVFAGSRGDHRAGTPRADDYKVEHLVVGILHAPTLRRSTGFGSDHLRKVEERGDRGREFIKRLSSRDDNRKAKRSSLIQDLVAQELVALTSIANGRGRLGSLKVERVCARKSSELVLKELGRGNEERGRVPVVRCARDVTGLRPQPSARIGPGMARRSS